MSRAFVREDDQDLSVPLQDRPMSAHRNFVTATGLAQIEAALATSNAAHSRAQTDGDREKLAETARDVRYWSTRRASAQVTEQPLGATIVQFGATVTILREDGREQTFRIVGEDEADPVAGTLSYVSPLARALIGKGAGDSGQVNGGPVEIISIG